MSTFVAAPKVFVLNFFSLTWLDFSCESAQGGCGGAKITPNVREGIKTKQSITGLLLLFPDGLWVT